MQHIRIKYNKGEELKFIGHLDLMRVFERGVRRAGIPIAYSQGFNPKMRISYGTPLPLGITSEAEYADFEINGWIKPDELKTKLNSSLPEGLKVIEAILIGPKEDSLMAKTEAVEYVVDLPAGTNNIKERIKEALDKKELKIKRKRKDSIKEIDIRPMIGSLEFDGNAIRMVVQSNSKGAVKPEEVLSILGVEEAKIKRTKQFPLDQK